MKPINIQAQEVGCGLPGSSICRGPGGDVQLVDGSQELWGQGFLGDQAGDGMHEGVVDAIMGQRLPDARREAVRLRPFSLRLELPPTKYPLHVGNAEVGP